MRHPLIFIPTLTMGGAERVAAVLANEWIKREQVTVLTYFDADHFYPLDSRVNVICLNRRAGRGAFARALDVFLAGLALRKVVQQLRPRFVLSFMNKYNAFAIWWLLGTGIPVLGSERGSPDEVLPRIRVFVRNILYPLAAGIIFQTEAARAAMSRKIRIERAGVIPNPVPRIIDPKARQPERIVLAVSRLVESKAVDQLIRAFETMQARNWRLVICGDGPLRAHLEEVARGTAARDRIEFVGATSDLAPFHRRAGIFAMTSLHEGFPNALAEAVVSGIPCVAYNCATGPADLINDGRSGRLVAVGDWAGLAKAMDEIAENEDKARAFAEAATAIGAQLEPSMISARFLSFCDAEVA